MDDFNMETGISVGGGTFHSILVNKEILPPPMRGTLSSKDDDSSEIYADATAAFLGPNIWEKTLSDFKVEYLDLDDLLSNSNDGSQIYSEAVDAGGQVSHTSQENPNICVTVHSLGAVSSQPSSPADTSAVQELPKDNRVYTVDCKFSPTDLALATPPGHKHYDPASAIIPEEELKPQPIIKKSRKTFVPDNLKDDKYWARRHKNNMAAKRSREARRLKENQIVLRASYLEKENNSLKEDVLRLKAENDMLKNQLKEFQS
ncbi:thyrotroph embryonic factor-like isoform X2 [Stegodyphus dumicola]|uniref:thyrotroph embryonic factor-like isoform X2 n=1 Tax=Stegodyphus dumicola TaxID=202533 RepID=UPI0015A93B43|nr:thyrotroph embryonic factor-like isoform X2 [Stegodyphus dumicola]